MSGDEDRGMRSLLFRGYVDGQPDYLTCDVRRIWNIDRLLVRTTLIGRQWKGGFDVEERPIAEVKPSWMHECREGRRWVLTFTLEEDVRERVLDEIRPGVFADWSDPRERLGVA